MQQIKFSMYQAKESQEKVDVSIDEYCEMILKGKYQDQILQARILKNKDKKEYSNFKNKLPVITSSAIMNAGSKTASNIKEMNGLLCIDIDDQVGIELIEKVNKDLYTFVSHRSIGGDGLCVYVKINPNKFKDSFNDLGQYYWDNFNIIIDKSCSNPNRLRFISYDPSLFRNDNSKKFIAKTTTKKEPKKENFVFAQNDFTEIISKVKDIDLCQDDYKRYTEIGFAIGSKFGLSGLDYFKAICQSGSKYNPKEIEKHYKNFCKSGNISIATFYFYVREAGIEIYSEQTKATIKAVNVQKAQGTATFESVSKHLTALKIDIDTDLINDLIESKTTFIVNDEGSNMAILEKFIVENYAPERNTITNEIKINDIVIDDHKLNSIYKTASKVLDFGVAKSDVRDILNSDSTKDFNPLKTFFATKDFEKGTIEKYINCIEPQSDFNVWAFKKWAVGCVHNWLSSNFEAKVSPLTLVLCGKKQGTGKTSFFRNLLPKDLQPYLIEHRIDGKDKDSMYNLVKGLLVLDDEFGGLATKDVKDFKKIADSNQIDIRLPYSAYYSKMKRKAGLCGTSNETDVLKDVTGNRRIIPIQVEKIDYNTLISIDTDSLWREVFSLFKSPDFDWKIYTSEDIDYLKLNTSQNIEVMPVEELFFKFFSIEENETFSQDVVFNQGEILDHLNRNISFNVTKYDVKDVFTKNNLSYKNYRYNGFVKKGVRLYIKKTDENSDEIPF